MPKNNLQKIRKKVTLSQTNLIQLNDRLNELGR